MQILPRETILITTINKSEEVKITLIKKEFFPHKNLTLQAFYVIRI